MLNCFCGFEIRAPYWSTAYVWVQSYLLQWRFQSYHIHTELSCYCTPRGMLWNFGHSSVLLWFVWAAEGVHCLCVVCLWDGDTEHHWCCSPTFPSSEPRNSPRLDLSSLPSVSATFHPHQPSFQIVSPLDPTMQLESRPSVCQSSVHLSICLFVQSHYAVFRQ